MALQAALDGQGVALCGLILAVDDLLSGRLVAPLGPTSALRAPYAYRLVIAPARRKLPLHTTFIRWIKNEARKSRKAISAFLAGDMESHASARAASSSRADA